MKKVKSVITVVAVFILLFSYGSMTANCQQQTGSKSTQTKPKTTQTTPKSKQTSSKPKPASSKSTPAVSKSEQDKKSKDIIDKLNELKKDTKTIIGIVQAHEHDLKILVDGVDQLTEEEAYRKEHLRLIIDVSNFLEKYRGIKKQVFKLIKGIIKEGKQKRLLP